MPCRPPLFYKARRLVTGLALLLPFAPPALAASPALRAQDVALLAASCANCHGPDGRSAGDIPALRGQTPERLRQRMLDFKHGKASDTTVMTRLMKGYETTEIDALAQWFGTDAARKERP